MRINTSELRHVERLTTGITIGGILLLGATACGEAKHAFLDGEELCMPYETDGQPTASQDETCYYGEMNP